MATFVSIRSSLVLLLVALLWIGCSEGGCGEAQSPDSEPASSSSDDVQQSSRQPLNRHLDVAELFEQSTVESSEAADSLRYVGPDCTTDYGLDVEIEQSAEVDGTPAPGGGQSMVIRGGFQTGPGEDHEMVIQNDEITQTFVSGAVVNPGSTQPAGTLADVWLTTDGAQWEEIDGPTILWSGYGSFTGVTIFFPALPAEVEEGARAEWNLEIFSQQSALAVEQRRGQVELPEGSTPPEPSAQIFSPTVELHQWWQIDGVPVVELRMPRWEYEYDETADLPDGSSEELARDMSAAVTGTKQGRYLFTAEGVLIFAEVSEDRRVTTTVGGEELVNSASFYSQVRLLSSECDVPALNPREVSESPAERAVQTYADFRNALVEGDSDNALELLSDEVLRTHGAEAIADVMTSYVEDFGPTALGMPEFPGETSYDDGQVRMERSGTLRTLDAGETIHVVVIAEVGDDDVRLQLIGVDPLVQDEDWSYLELSSDRLWRVPNP